MSPTVFYEKDYRFFFFSREETRVHIHVSCSRGEAKFWLEPAVSLAQNYGLSARELKSIEKIVEEHKDAIKTKWERRFKTR